MSEKFCLHFSFHCRLQSVSEGKHDQCPDSMTTEDSNDLGKNLMNQLLICKLSLNPPVKLDVFFTFLYS